MLVPASPLVRDIQPLQLMASDTMPPDAIIVRGYLGSPVDVLTQASRILFANGHGGMITAPAFTDVMTPTVFNAVPWRIYLTARLDCWIEVPDWGGNVLRAVPETSADRADAYTVWLRTRIGGVPVRYRVVSVRVLNDEDGIVSGRLVEDYMSHAESSNVVWDEQAFGPTTGKKSSGNCF